MAGFDLTEIAKQIEKMGNSDLIRITTKEARGLRPEVLDLLEKEIIKRNLNSDIMKGVIAQAKKYPNAQLEIYAEKLRKIPCPICNQTHKKLNGTIAYTVKSFVFFSSFAKKPIIACPECLDRENNNSITSTLLLGWWGFPLGILKTPIYIYRNMKIKDQNHFERANETLLSFTLSNVGEIETYIDNSERLKRIITLKK
jgi:hypothetical protein